MLTKQGIWVLVVVVIVVVIVAMWAKSSRKRGRETAARQQASDRQQTASLRATARDTAWAALESDAFATEPATGMAAEPEHAEMDAERLRSRAEKWRTAAAAQTAESMRDRRQANFIDPDVAERQSEGACIERGPGSDARQASRRVGEES